MIASMDVINSVISRRMKANKLESEDHKDCDGSASFFAGSGVSPRLLV